MLAATPLAVLAGCDKPVRTQTVILAAALIAVTIGKRMVKLPNPAMRIVGIVLVVGSEVVIDYLDYSEGKHSEHIAISIEESHELQNTKSLAFTRQDGGIEAHAIGKETYA